MLEINSDEYNRRMGHYVKFLNHYPEKWKTVQIDGMNTVYEISNCGRLHNSQTKRMIEPEYGINNYQYVAVYHNNKRFGFRTHRLVATYFCKIPNRFKSIDLSYDKLVVNHKNGIKRCNAAFNLEWCTHYENMQHAFNTGLCTDIYGEKSHLSNISNDTVVTICELIMERKTNDEISKLLGVTNKTIQHIRSKECWRQIVNEYDFPRLSSVVPYSIPDSKIHEVCKYLQEHKYTDTEIAEKTGLQRRYITEIRNGDKRMDISSLYDIDRSAVTRDITSNIHEACRLLEAGNLSQRRIAELVDVSQATVSDVFNHKKYTDISINYNF